MVNVELAAGAGIRQQTTLPLQVGRSMSQRRINDNGADIQTQYYGCNEKEN